MYACVCSAVTVDEVTDAIDAGADSVDMIGTCTRAGTTCGSCHDTLDELLETRCGPCPLVATASVG